MQGKPIGKRTRFTTPPPAPLKPSGLTMELSLKHYSRHQTKPRAMFTFQCMQVCGLHISVFLWYKIRYIICFLINLVLLHLFKASLFFRRCVVMNSVHTSRMSTVKYKKAWRVGYCTAVPCTYMAVLIHITGYIPATQ